MIERYTSKEMFELWSEESKLHSWLEVELAVAKAQSELNIIPKSAYQQMKSKAKINAKRAAEIEKVTNHDIIAFVSSTAESIGDAGRYLHFGCTSTDIVDTAQALRLRQASDLIWSQLIRLEKILLQQTKKHKTTIMVGRSHGVHAEPITFGLKLAVFLAEIRRQKERLMHARKAVEVGMLSGAVGTYANQDPRVEEKVCRQLKLEAEMPSTQVVSRDRHAEYICALAQLAGTLENIAVEIRHLHRTEVREVEEYFAKGQKGSSAMPHKKNPIICERITGLARMMRGYASAALENMALWHERDISHSSVERMILPDATATIEYMLKLSCNVMENIVVYPLNMKKNLELTFGLIHSQQVLLTLVKKGVSRDQAYKKVQDLAMKAWAEQVSLKELVTQDKELNQLLKAKDLEECFDLSYHTKHVDSIYRKLGLIK